MTKVCAGCRYWIAFENGSWVDGDNDDQCYDDELNLIGSHEPKPARSALV